MRKRADDIELLEQDIDELFEQLEELEGIVSAARDSYAGENVAAMELLAETEGRCAELSGECEDLKYKLTKARRDCETLSEALDEAYRSERSAGASVMANLERFPKTVPEVLRLAQGLWPERIVVLDPALRDRASQGVSVDEAWSIVKAVAVTLWDLRWGGDVPSSSVAGEFERITGFQFGRHEGKETMANKRSRAERTFLWDGRPTEFTAHVKGRNAAKKGSTRCYLYLDDERKVIAIGYLGPHLWVRGGLK